MASNDETAVKINLSRDFETNGVVIPAGTHEVPKVLADDLIRREASYQKYREGITEKRDYMSRAGNISMGDGN